jgi:hypothetical protein
LVPALSLLAVRHKFVAMSRNAAHIDIDAFRADQEAVLDQEPQTPISSNAHEQGLLDTNILILRRWINPAELRRMPTMSSMLVRPR